MTSSRVPPISDPSAQRHSVKKRISRRKKTPEQKTATALHYQPGAADIAPVIIAQEQGELAQELLNLARLKNIPVKEDADLASLLSAIGVGEEIPIEAFLVIAELFRHLYQDEGIAPPPVEGEVSRYWKGKDK